MKRRVVGIFTSFILACAIFSISIYKGVNSRYAFSPQVLSTTSTPNDITIEYYMVYPGKIKPDSPLWFAKALRDKVQHTLTFNHMTQARLSLICADKRLLMAQELFEKGKPDLGMSTLVKGEKYLSMAVEHAKESKSMDKSLDFFEKAALASLKHREIIEENILPKTPDDLKPEVVKTEDYSKNTYKASRDILRNNGITAPKNPFDIE